MQTRLHSGIISVRQTEPSIDSIHQRFTAKRRTFPKADSREPIGEKRRFSVAWQEVEQVYRLFARFTFDFPRSGRTLDGDDDRWTWNDERMDGVFGDRGRGSETKSGGEIALKIWSRLSREPGPSHNSWRFPLGRSRVSSNRGKQRRVALSSPLSFPSRERVCSARLLRESRLPSAGVARDLTRRGHFPRLCDAQGEGKKVSATDRDRFNILRARALNRCPYVKVTAPIQRRR